MVQSIKITEKYIKVLADAENAYYHEHFDTKINSIKQLWLNMNRIFSSLSKAKSNTIVLVN